MLKLGEVKPGSMVVDMDDILVYTTNLWFKYIMDNYEIFKPYLNEDVIPENYDYSTHFNYPLTRPCYMFTDWLLKEGLSVEDQLVGRRFIMEAYHEQVNYFYRTVISTPLVDSLISMFKYKNFNFDKIYIVTRTFDNFEKEKIECIKRLFAPIIKDVEIRFTDIGEKKSDVIKDIENVSIIFDDELSNIYDYLDNSGDNINNCVMMMPITGYNTPFDKEYENKAKDRNITLRYYNYND